MRARLLRAVLVAPLFAASILPGQNFGAKLVQAPERVQMTSQQTPYYMTVATKRVRRRSKKKSAAIVGGTALGGAAIGGLAGGKKGAAIGALAGAGGGYVYDRKTQAKPIIPK